MNKELLIILQTIFERKTNNTLCKATFNSAKENDEYRSFVKCHQCPLVYKDGYNSKYLYMPNMIQTFKSIE